MLTPPVLLPWEAWTDSAHADYEANRQAGLQLQSARDDALFAWNTALNGLAATASFAASNLFELTPALLAGHGHADKWLVDPPREGAFALARALVDLHADATLAPGYVPPRRIVYVSCNPATLARDAGLLVHQAGYRCTAAGAVNMFPHTAHVESLAVFDRETSAQGCVA